MSLSVAGVWAVDVWDQTVWADDVWREGEYIPSSGGPSISDDITRPVTGNITRLVTETSFFY